MRLTVRPNGEFGTWLYNFLKKNKIPIYDMAEDIHISPRAVYRHIKGEDKPTFAHVAAYCWYINEVSFENNDPMDIYYTYVERS